MPAEVAASRIALSEPLLSGNEWAYVKDCLDSGWVSSAGAYTERFERELAEATGAAQAVVTASGTAALHAALAAAGIGGDDEVAVSALTFIAPANVVRYVGAWPVFIDAEPHHMQIDVNALEAFLREGCERTAAGLRNRVTHRIVRALLPVHLLGHPCDLDRIMALASELGLTVVEDATESLGARYRGRAVGHHGLAGCLSFNGNKLITTGGGGAVLTDDAALASRVRHLTTQAKADPIESVHDTIGFNYRMTNMQAALGCAQLESLRDRLSARRRINARYRELLAGVDGVTVPEEAPWAASSFWLTTVLIDPDASAASSRDVMRALAREGIESRPLWQPLHRSPAHAEAQRVACPVADRLHRDALSLPSSPQLSAGELDRVASIVRRACAGRR